MASKNYVVMKDKDLAMIMADRKLTYKEGTLRKDIIDMLRSWDIEHGEAETVIEDTGEEGGLVEVGLPDKDKTNGNKKLTPWVKVTFHNLREDDPPYVFVGYQGKAFYLPKEKQIWIPEYIINSCIKDAVELHMTLKTHPNGNRERIPRKVQRFPYTLHERKMR